ncbi:amino acid permease-associated region [Beijerinckia indica subsp. indica ATCC 9039]|uniref:Amino acid permease-associated region n=2 Tax=Beijerinckia TaxID=532 RepID=B2IBY4_BEII9|nr:amino acid permease-associated region [Beijerinckia indica subsp. indica ATCC 9039]
MTAQNKIIDVGDSKLVQPATAPRELRSNCLSYTEVLAQSVSVIAPSTVPAAILGLIYATAGNGTWLSFLMGMTGLVLVSFNINQFARRSASPGSLYTYIVKGLGPTAGVLGGWALLFAYMVTGMSTLCGFGIIGSLLLGQIGIHTHILVLFAIGALGACYIAFRDIQLSAKMMLVFEGVSLLAILMLGILIWMNKGFALDTKQLTLEGATPGGVLAGIVLVVFGFSGFESSTSLGDEAKDPLRAIPRSVIQSVVISGLVFIFMTYVVVMGFEGTGADLGKTEAPIDFLANLMGFKFLGVLINIGILLSFFSCTLAAVNSTARVVFSMARHGLFSDALGEAHEKNETPYIAVFLSALITFLVPTGLYLVGVSAFESQGYFGTLCSFGFLLVYMLISIAAPVYLSSIGKLSVSAILFSLLGGGFMLLPFVGTVGIPGSDLFPPMEFANKILFGVFLTYMAIGLAWLLLQRNRHPDMIPEMRSSIESVDLKFANASSISKTVIH